MANDKSLVFSFPVRGMTCAACAAHLEVVLSHISGVNRAFVNLARGAATVEVKQGTSWAALVRAVKEAGYEVPTETVVLPIGGMTCAACVAHVEEALRSLPGVVSVVGNLAAEKATVTSILSVVGEAFLSPKVRGERNFRRGTRSCWRVRVQD